MRNQRAERRNVQGNVKLDVGQGEKSGKIVAELTDVTKRYGSRTVIDSFTATVMRGDKIGFVGPNGAGKTTLLKIILGELQPDEGTVRVGTNLQVAYFDQMRAQLDLDKSLADTISPGSEWVEVNGQKKHVMSYLGDFLFAPERARSPVKSLSGGERNRLLLARLFARPANVLVLDEPTNDLDIPTLELLEELLTDYDGTVLLVSHDRAFLDNVATSVIASEGGGKWREYVGGFTDWQIQSQRSQQMAQEAQKEASKEAAKDSAKDSAASKDSPAGRNAQRAPKLSFKEQRELEGLPEKIAALEAEQKAIGAQLEDGAIFAKDAQEGKRLSERYAAIDEELLLALERWDELEKRRK
jgi:ATP-binding cassette subfamily F protein uup